METSVKVRTWQTIERLLELSDRFWRMGRQEVGESQNSLQTGEELTVPLGEGQKTVVLMGMGV